MADIQIHPMPDEVLDRVRAADAAERLTAEGGEPLRCCLRRAEPGEQILLFAYELPLPPGPYRERGPVYAHSAPCAGPQDAGYPATFLGTVQTLRAYDAEGRIHPATHVHDGSDPEAEIAAMLADPDVVQIHVRNPSYGCFLFQVTRAA